MEKSRKIKGTLTGAWKWNQEYWCRNINVGSNKLGSDCQTVEIDGNQIPFTRNQGKGDAGVYILK